MKDQAADLGSLRLLRAAQYLRMSTDHQQYSIANQAAAIALYAAAHNIAIVRSFIDEGKTGTTIKGRFGLQQLLETVQSSIADFNLILVYDVSRWGRFLDVDEAAHYEFLCKKAGISICYCAEQFENDNSTASNLLKVLKRTMAGEYSRELSRRISEGHRRLASMGFWHGGYAPFGMQRQIVGETGRPKEILKFGQWKRIKTDRIVLILGPPNEVKTIQLAFKLYADEQKSRDEIAEILNRRNQLWGATPWNKEKLLRLLRNPIYKGAYAYPRTRGKKALREDEWSVREHAFPAIIPDRQWNQARERVREEVRRPVDSEMLEGLRQVWQREGKLNSNLINAAKDLPSPPAYERHFGSLIEAYKLIGYPIKYDRGYIHAIKQTRRLRSKLLDDICAQIRRIGGCVEIVHPEQLLINRNITARIRLTIGHCRKGLADETRWRLSLGKKPSVDLQIFGRLDPPNRDISDYFVIPAISGLEGALCSKRGTNPPFLQIYRFSTLEPLIKTFGRVSMVKPA